MLLLQPNFIHSRAQIEDKLYGWEQEKVMPLKSIFTICVKKSVKISFAIIGIWDIKLGLRQNSGGISIHQFF